jgi:hypothetical protein
VLDISAPMAVLWFRMSRLPSDPGIRRQFLQGAIFVLISQGDCQQCTSSPRTRWNRRGSAVSEASPGYRKQAPFMKGRAGDQGFDDQAVDRRRRQLKRCTGRAALHRRRPCHVADRRQHQSGDQDAVAANLLAAPLRRGAVTDADLHVVQERREPPTRKTQAMQVFLQKNVITAVLGSPEQPKPPLFLRMIARWPWLARFPARILGLGFRPEHVDLAVIDGQALGGFSKRTADERRYTWLGSEIVHICRNESCAPRSGAKEIIALNHVASCVQLSRSAFIGGYLRSSAVFLLAFLSRLAPEQDRRLTFVVGAGEFGEPGLGDIDRRRVSDGSGSRRLWSTASPSRGALTNLGGVALAMAAGASAQPISGSPPRGA